MNILYIDHYAGSPEMGMEFRPYHLSKEWVKSGHRVTIIAASFSHLRSYNPVIKKDFECEYVDGIEYSWITTGTYKGNGIQRALTIFQFVWKLWTKATFIAKRWQPDVVIASSTYPLDTYAAQKIAKKSGAKYVHEVHDMWPATLYEIGGMSRAHPFVQILQAAEDYAYHHCDLCVSLLPYTKDYMMRHGLPGDRFINLQNGVTEEDWTSFRPLPAVHASFFSQHSDKFIIGYFGGHAESNALDYILDAAKVIESEQIIFVLVGKGVEKERLVRRAQIEQINNVFFLDSVSKACIPSLLEKFDCCIIVGKDSPLYRFGLCINKMYDAMMAAKPIIIAINAPPTLVEEYQCGLQIYDVSPDAISLAVSQVYHMSSAERDMMGKNGQKAVLEHFTYSKLAERFINAIDGIR